MPHQTATVRGVRLHYIEAGTGTPLVLLAGWPQTSHAWRKVIPHLAEHYRVIAVDVRGQGASEHPGFGYDALSIASDLRALTAQLGAERALVAGHGLGAWAAYAYAAIHPDRVTALAAIDAPVPGFVSEKHLARMPAAIAWPTAMHREPALGASLVAGKEDALLRGLFDDALDRDAIAIDEYARWHGNAVALDTGVAFHRAASDRSLDGIEPIAMPVLALGAERSMGAGMAAALRERASDVTAATMAGTGHYALEEQPQIVAAEMHKFFNGNHGLKFGVHTFVFTRRFVVTDLPLLPKIKSHGFDGVEIGRYDFDDFPVAKIAQGVRAAGLAATLVTGLNAGMSLIDPDAAVRKKAVTFLQDAVKIGAELNAEMISGPIFAPGYAFTGVRRTADEWARAVECLHTVGESLTEYKMRLAIEPLNRYQTYFLNTQADTKKLCDDVGHPGLGVLFDMFHANIEEKHLGASLKMLGSRLFHVHASENDRGTPGSGHNSWLEVARALREMHFKGWVVIESFTWEEPAMASAAKIWRNLAPRPCDIAWDGLPFLKTTFGGKP